jgi:hypothetical protein
MRPRAVELRVENGPTVAGAIDRVVDAAQHVVQDQIGLARLETVTAARQMLRGALMALAGAVLLLIAWIALGMAAYVMLESTLLPAERLGILAALNAVLGSVLILVGMRLTR